MGQGHKLRTPNEGMNQRNLKIWPVWQAKYDAKNLGVGMDFWPCSEDDFLTGHSQSMVRGLENNETLITFSDL